MFICCSGMLFELLNAYEVTCLCVPTRCIAMDL